MRLYFGPLCWRGLQIWFQLDGEAGVLIIEVGIFLLQLGSCPKTVVEVEQKQSRRFTGVRKLMGQPVSPLSYIRSKTPRHSRVFKKKSRRPTPSHLCWKSSREASGLQSKGGFCIACFWCQWSILGAAQLAVLRLFWLRASAKLYQNKEGNAVLVLCKLPWIHAV